jgi:hypothetical protein
LAAFRWRYSRKSGECHEAAKIRVCRESPLKHGERLFLGLGMLPLSERVASACDGVETSVLNNFCRDHVQIFRRMLFDIIGDSEDRGSCL